MIQLQQISLRLGQKQLFEELDCTIYEGYKVGIIGANGTGKSTLLKIIQAQLEPDKGDVAIPKQLMMAHLKQEVSYGDITAQDYCELGDTQLAALREKIQQAEINNDGIGIAEGYTRLGEIDGFAAPARASKILVGLGFDQQQLNQSVNSFSGGWRMRLNLAQVLMAPADILLLDEPTNHLDMEAIIWLESWLQNFSKTLIIISHDRDFLDNTVKHIAHLEHKKIKLYGGGYTQFEDEYATQLALQQATYQKQQAHIAHLQKFVDRFRAKASKAKQAQSRLKMISRIDKVAMVQSKNPLRFQFKEPSYAGNPLIKMHRATLGYGTKEILHKVSWSIATGDRIGLLGINGAGKSTLIKSLAGEIDILQGERTASPKLNIGYFTQHQLEKLHANSSPIAHLRDLAPTISDSDARAYLGSFNFQGNRVFEEIANFSGGEKARLALALLIWTAPNLLLLDEPTNHFDMDMREALSLALQEYQGAIVVVSHDRHLLNTIVDQLWLVHDGVVGPFNGDLDDYRQMVLGSAT